MTTESGFVAGTVLWFRPDAGKGVVKADDGHRFFFGKGAGVAAAGIAACETGAYPVDIFPEMHYQQSYKAQEPDRLDVPVGAVPYYSLKATKTGAELFAINCSKWVLNS